MDYYNLEPAPEAEAALNHKIKIELKEISES
jgi:hypothetical protein